MSSLCGFLFPVVVSCYRLALVEFVNMIAPCVLCFGKESKGACHVLFALGLQGAERAARVRDSVTIQHVMVGRE